MGKVINLDQFVTDDVVILGGQEYPLGTNLEGVLEFWKASEEFKSAGNDIDRLQVGLKGIKLVLPTMGEKQILGLNLKQTTVLMAAVSEMLSLGGTDGKGAGQAPQVGGQEAGAPDPQEQSQEAGAPDPQEQSQ